MFIIMFSLVHDHLKRRIVLFYRGSGSRICHVEGTKPNTGSGESLVHL